MDRYGSLNLREICQILSRKEFRLKSEIVGNINVLYDSKKQLRKLYANIRSIFSDKRFSWKEVDQLQEFLNLQVPNSCDPNWEKKFSSLIDLMSLSRKMYQKIQYIHDIERRIFPEGYESNKRVLYFLNGRIFSDTIKRITDIIEFSSISSEKAENSSKLELKIIRLIQNLGLIGETTLPYVIITPIEEENDPNHPLSQKNEFWKLNNQIKKEIESFPSKKLLEISVTASKGLEKFLEKKKISEDQFPIESFWGPKKGISDIQILFNYLEEIFEFEDQFKFMIW